LIFHVILIEEICPRSR